MLNLFYIPPPKGPEKHPRTLGVRTVTKRNQPTRLEFGPPLVGTGSDGHNLPSYVPTVVDVTDQPMVVMVPKVSLRQRFGARLIRWGEALSGSIKEPLGQPAH